MNKTENNKAWFLVLPVFLLVAFSAIIPLMTVVNYSVQDIFDQNTAYFVGAEWYKEVLQDPRLHDSLLRQFAFSGAVLLIEIPLGILVALMMPTRGVMASLSLILLAIPLLIPWNVVGTIWQIFGRADIGLFGWALTSLGVDYNYASNPIDAWFTVLLMDVWHWTSLVALLCYSGSASDSGSLLSGCQHRQSFQVGNLPLYSAAKVEECTDHRCPAALYGQFYDLHRAIRTDRWRTGQLNHFSESDPDQNGHRPV